jgi:hypothetical protein
VDSETVWQADAVALADRISALLTVVRSAEAEIGSLLAEIESRGVMELFGYRSVARLFEHLADVPKSAAEAPPFPLWLPPPALPRRRAG